MNSKMNLIEVIILKKSPKKKTLNYTIKTNVIILNQLSTSSKEFCLVV